MGLLPFEQKKRNLIVKRNAETSPKYGKKPAERTADELIHSGIVVIDKPSGPSSHQVSAYAKHILKLDKTGHSGTLDPKVTGILPVALGKGTRIVQSLLLSGKEYIALMYLHQEVEEHRIRAVVEKFTGRIKQLPPVKSAVKRELRERTIYYIELIDIQKNSVLFKVGCQAGTYIRKLIHDMGLDLGVNAQMAELRRTKAGPFQEKDLVTLQQLSDAFYYHTEKHDDTQLKQCIMPIESAITHLPRIYVMDTTIDSICHGAQLKIPGITSFDNTIQKNEMIAILSLKGELIAVGTAELDAQDLMKQEKGIAASLSQVFMAAGTYPRMDRAISTI
jgi:H/ACA ribonucleoprotein complex subunit 4